MTTSQLAIYAAKHRLIWGPDAARKFVKNKGVHQGLYRLACQLEAIAKVERFPSMLTNQAI